MNFIHCDDEYMCLCNNGAMTRKWLHHSQRHVRALTGGHHIQQQIRRPSSPNLLAFEMKVIYAFQVNCFMGRHFWLKYLTAYLEMTTKLLHTVRIRFSWTVTELKFFRVIHQISTAVLIMVSLLHLLHI